MKILFFTSFFTLLRPEPLICQENLTASRLMQYYVRINAASKNNPNHIIEDFPVLLPVSHIEIVGGIEVINYKSLLQQTYMSRLGYSTNWLHKKSNTSVIETWKNNLKI